MSYQLKVIKDYPIGFWMLDETSGTTASDSSGCENNGIYTGSLTTNLLPLVPGGKHASKITNTSYITLSVENDYYGSTASGGLANSDTSDNDFSLEVWIHPRFNTYYIAPLLADSTKDVGIFWENGNIVFQLNDERLDYTVPYTSKSLHIVATYSPSQMNLYIDGKLASTKQLSGFKFNNASFTPSIGPTADASDSFLVDAPAIYRYDIGPVKIFNHYNEIQPLTPIQIAYPEGGEIFDFYDNSISKQWSYSYPANKAWEYFLTDELYFNNLDNSIEISKSTGPKSVVLEDILTVPVSLFLDSSKIEWDGDNGVSVETSLDGITYSTCTNGGTIPGYTIDSFDPNRIIYLKITLSTVDSSKHIPKLSNLIITFYNDQKLYALNSGSYFSTLEGVSGITEFDVTMPNQSYPILSRHGRNGVKTIVNSGFFINTSNEIKTLELFFTPFALNDDGGIIETEDGNYLASIYKWNNTGAITKTGISAIYVNGVNKTSQTNIANVFTENELHHVIIVYTAAISGQLKFSHTAYGSIPDLIQNIALYPNQFTAQEALDHYNLYVGKSSLIADDSSFAVTENAVSIYDNDWRVIKTI